MQGLGNDFMVIDNMSGNISLRKEKRKQLGTRQIGIGFDQLLIVSKSDVADFKYQIFNADGGEVEQCGNGARCFAIFVYEKGLTTKKEIIVETKTGNITLKINDDDDVNTDKRVTVDMGKPDLTPNNGYPLMPYDELFGFDYDFVSMGNPHVVLIYRNIAKKDVKKIGLEFQKSSYFPDSVNVNFVEVINRNKIKLRTYERGVGETLACGSGACASVAFLQKKGHLDNKVIVEQAGGELLIEYNGSGTVKMTGDAQFVFEGEIEL